MFYRRVSFLSPAVFAALALTACGDQSTDNAADQALVMTVDVTANEANLASFNAVSGGSKPADYDQPVVYASNGSVNADSQAQSDETTTQEAMVGTVNTGMSDIDAQMRDTDNQMSLASRRLGDAARNAEAAAEASRRAAEQGR
jgi:methyl-accepting chemotaxis protein